VGLPRELLNERLFPGATVVDWMPLYVLQGRKQKAAASTIEDIAFVDGSMAIADFAKEVGFKHRRQMIKMLSQDRMLRGYLREKGIEYRIEGDRLFAASTKVAKAA